MYNIIGNFDGKAIREYSCTERFSQISFNCLHSLSYKRQIIYQLELKLLYGSHHEAVSKPRRK